MERGRKEASSELLSAICGALDVPLSRVLSEAGDDLALEEARAAMATVTVGVPPGAVGIDAATKVVIPQVVSMAVA